MRLIWVHYQDAIFGNAVRLDGLPRPDDVATCHREPNGRYVANAYIDKRLMWHHGATRAQACRQLEQEIDKRSIGLLGVDDIHFQGPETEGS